MNLSVQNFETFDGTAWNCKLLFDGKKVGSVVQAGDGSANKYYFDDKQNRTLFNQSFVGEFKQMDAVEIALQKEGF